MNWKNTAATDELVVAKRPPPASGVNRSGEGLVQEEDHEELLPAIVDPDKLSCEIFSILESKFLFGYDERNNGASGRFPPPLPADAYSAASIRTQRGKVRLLCIDGGGARGMRGLLPAKALAYLEQSLRAKSGDPDACLADYFDLVAGTGLGGLLSAMLFATRDGGRPIFRADDACRFVLDNASRLFPHTPSSSSSVGFFRRLGGSSSVAAATAAMERTAKEAFGEGLTLRNTVKPVLIPCYDLRSSAPLVFSRADALENESFDFRLWEVSRATCAEPGRFEPAEMWSVDGATACVGIDGGLAMGNPAAAAITHVLHNKQEFPFVRGVEDLMVLSLGCGSSANGGGGVAVPEADRHRLRRWGRKEWARPMARIAADTSADLVDHAVALAFGQCRSSNYIRIQANGSSMNGYGRDMDCDPSPANVKIMLQAADEMLKQKNVESVMFGGKRIGEQTNMEKLDWFAGELVLEHRTRSCRIAPTVAFKQVRHEPPEDWKLMLEQQMRSFQVAPTVSLKFMRRRIFKEGTEIQYQALIIFSKKEADFSSYYMHSASRIQQHVMQKYTYKYFWLICFPLVIAPWMPITLTLTFIGLLSVIDSLTRPNVATTS